MAKIVKITEAQYCDYVGTTCFLSEDVYVSSLDRKKNIANIEYNRNSYGNNLLKKDFLKTDKMDANNDDTYEVPLKGGLISYNITAIRGKEIMHYFKRLFGETKVKIDQEEYQIEMNEPDKKAFMEQFNRKVDIVTKKKIDDFVKENPDVEFSQVAIYPVPSSSNFNIAMAQRMTFSNICGLPTTVINSNILRKNTENLKKDEKFIQNNQEYYNQRRSDMDGLPGTHAEAIESGLNRLMSFAEIEKAINYANRCAKTLINKYYNRTQQQNNSQFAEQISNLYFEYHKAVKTIYDASRYYDVAGQKYHNQQFKKIAKAIKYSKGQQIEKRTGEIFDFIKSTSKHADFDKKHMIDVCLWEPIPFEIKKLGNDVRMALMNYFQPNGEADEIQKEVEKTKNSVVVIFDDNVSGGATLADICYQLQQLGMKYLVPITFGKMSEQWSTGIYGINRPKGGFNMQTQSENKKHNHRNMINEIQNVATKSNITVASLNDFKKIVSNLGLNDTNVEKTFGKYCFIEIGSCLPRLKVEIPHNVEMSDENGNPYDAEDFYNNGQWGFAKEHSNVIHLVFDDHQSIGQSKKTPGYTTVKLSSAETRQGMKNGFEYPDGADFTSEMASRLKSFVDNNLSANPDVKFIIHCFQGKSRSAAIGMYIAKKINQFTDDFLSEYDTDNGSQFRMGVGRKGEPRYPHKNAMTRMGELEGWNTPKQKDKTKEQWFYDRLYNHPQTGVRDARTQWENNKNNK